MTRAYVENNPCILAVNTAWNNIYLQGNRKGLYTQIFFMFIVYFISQILHAFKFKNRSPSKRITLSNSNQPSRNTYVDENYIQKQQKNEQKSDDERPDLPWHEKRWNRNFSFLFSSHAVALGMVILFSPLAGALVVAYLHLLVYLLYCLCEYKLMILPSKLMRMAMDTLNLTLMIIGAAGINQAQYCKDKFGNLVCCRAL